MKKSKFKEPYKKVKKEGKNFIIPNFEHKKLSNKSGVYLIKSNRTKKIVYVGMSGYNLYKTMYRHFQKWADSSQKRVVYKKSGYTVRLVLTTPKQAERLERYLIVKIKPKDNPNKLELYSPTKQDERDYIDYSKTVLTDLPF